MRAQTGAGYDIKIFDFATRGIAHDHRRHRQQRESGVLAERPAHRVHVDARRQGTDFRDRSRREEPAPDYAERDESLSELVAVRRSASHRVSRNEEQGQRRKVKAAVIKQTQTRAKDDDRRCCVLVVRWPSLMTVGRVREEEAAGREADDSPAGDGHDDGNRPPAPPEPVREPVPVPAEPMTSDTLSSSDIDTINKNSPFQPVFFALDQDTIDATGQQALNNNAELMKKYPTLGGHDRGTLRRARHRGIQPGARRAARAGGAQLSRLARHSRRPAAHGQLRQGVPVRARATTRGRGRRTGARTSSSPASSESRKKVKGMRYKR